MKHNDEAMDAGTSANKQELIKKRLYEFTILKESDIECKTAMVVFTARSEGSDVDVITEITGYGRDFVQEIANRMRRSSVWTNKSFHCDDWDHPEKGLAAFALDSLVAKGSFIPEYRDGKYRYQKVRRGAPQLPAGSQYVRQPQLEPRPRGVNCAEQKKVHKHAGL